jgi:hypothetical protein
MNDSPEDQEIVVERFTVWEGSVPRDALVAAVSRHPLFPPDTAERLLGSRDKSGEIALALPEGTYGVLKYSPDNDADNHAWVTVLAETPTGSVCRIWDDLVSLVTELGLIPWYAEHPPDDSVIRALFADAVVPCFDWHFALSSDMTGIESVLRAALATIPDWSQQQNRHGMGYAVVYAPTEVRRLTLYGADVALVLPAKRLVLEHFRSFHFGSSPPRVTVVTGWDALAWAWLFPLARERTELVVGSFESSIAEALRRFVESRWPEAIRLDSLDTIWVKVRSSSHQAQAPSQGGAFSDPAVLSVLEHLRGQKRAVASAALKGMDARAIFEALGGAVRRETIQVYLWEFRTYERFKAFQPYLCPPDEAYSTWGRQAHVRP